MALDEQNRRRKNAQQQKRYREDAAFRLEAINRNRARAGRPTIASLDESSKLRIEAGNV